MRTLAPLCVLVASVLQAQNAPAVHSPEITADRRVTFRLRAPAAKEVTLSGEFQKGSRPMEKGADGVWSVTVGPIEPEIYNYVFTVDGVRIIDPANAQVKTGSTPSTIMSILDVKGDKPAFYDPQPVPHGEVRTHWYESKSLKYTRRLVVYTPPGYDANPRKRYPVLYLFHGANADENAWTRLGRANLILDNLLASGSIRPFVVVMPFGYGIPPGTAAPDRNGPSNTELFGRDLMGDVIPFVDAHYRTMSDRDHRAIAGLSMGGGESLEIGLNHLDLFSYVGGFSAGLRSTDYEKTFGALTADAAAANRQLRLLWIGCGTDDSLFAPNRDFSKFLEAAKIKHTFRQSEGEHTWIVWRRYLKEFAPLLFETASASADRPAPVRIILVGDSTVAPKNGWGPGFSTFLTPEVKLLNQAKNGRSSSSYRGEGSWAAVMNELKTDSDYSATYVLIQFGHNDQPGKPGRSTDLVTEFPVNIRRYVQDVKAEGVIPVLVTPLTRRIFQDGKVQNNLGPWAEAILKIGEEEHVAVLDLNAESVAAVQKMGPVEANTMAMVPPPPEITATAARGTSQPAPKAPPENAGDSAAVFDYTHLGEKGSLYFGRMVADELARAVPELRMYIKLK
jgi:enterochelin esterase family protein